MEKTVFLLDDDSSIRDLVKFSLDMNGIHCACFSTVAEFNEALETQTPQVALIDIMLGDGNGLEVLTKVKAAHADIWCIMLSALGQELDKVKALNMGADDYITKPFGVLELCARVNAALRHSKQAKLLVKGEFEMDSDSMVIRKNGEVLDLNNKEYRLMRFFLENEGKVLSRELLLDSIWGYGNGETRTLDNHIARLRKLGIDNIETVFGVGYKFRV